MPVLYSTTSSRYMCTYIIPPQSNVLLGRLKLPQPLKKFPELCGIWKFITVFTRLRRMSLSWATRTQSHPTPVRYILILSSDLLLGLARGFKILLAIQFLPSLSQTHFVTNFENHLSRALSEWTYVLRT